MLGSVWLCGAWCKWDKGCLGTQRRPPGGPAGVLIVGQGLGPTILQSVTLLGRGQVRLGAILAAKVASTL